MTRSSIDRWFAGLESALSSFLRSVALPVVILFGVCTLPGCVAVDVEGDDEGGDQEGPEPSTELVLQAEELAGRDSVRIPANRPFRLVGLRWDGSPGEPLQLEHRVQLPDGGWSDWETVLVTWHEGIASNGGFVLSQAGEELELRSLSVPPSFLIVELFDEESVAVALGETAQGLATLTQALVPEDLARRRALWGARAHRCGSLVPKNLSYITIHHTDTPNNDSMTPEARMRQMQAYHIDQRGWCDIGYHFVISQDGRAWQGRDDERRTGAHVANHNTGNVGISFMGNFNQRMPSAAMIGAARRLVTWLTANRGIPADRRHILGHREWAGASTDCPGNAFQPQLGQLLPGAAAPVEDDDPEDGGDDGKADAPAGGGGGQPAPAPQCPLGEGLFCGNLLLGLTPGNLYRCRQGTWTVEQACQRGCEVRPGVGQDRCMAVVAANRCPLGNGVYCGASVGRNVNTLYRCTNGNYTILEMCGNGCHQAPSGSADRCEAPPACPQGDGQYCGSALGRDAQKLYRCQAGVITELQACALGCTRSASGREDACTLPPPACPAGDGLYCGETVARPAGTLYRCTTGIYTQVAVCNRGCQDRPLGTDDACVPEPEPEPEPDPEPQPQPSVCFNGEGLYCGDWFDLDPDTLYECRNGQLTVEQICAAGRCHISDPDVNDYCEVSAQGGICPLGDGLYCGSWFELDPKTVYLCIGGQLWVNEVCPGVCRVSEQYHDRCE